MTTPLFAHLFLDEPVQSVVADVGQIPEVHFGRKHGEV